MGTAFLAAFAGAALSARVPAALMRWIVLGMLVSMLVYTVGNRGFGRSGTVAPVRRPLSWLIPAAIGAAVGFYDGLVGPGTGAVLIFLLVRYFALDFLAASAHAKLINLGTNLAALLFFVPTHNYLPALVAPMIAANLAGARFGSHLALRHGQALVKRAFLVMTILLILKMVNELGSGR